MDWWNSISWNYSAISGKKWQLENENPGENATIKTSFPLQKIDLANFIPTIIRFDLIDNRVHQFSQLYSEKRLAYQDQTPSLSWMFRLAWLQGDWLLDVDFSYCFLNVDVSYCLLNVDVSYCLLFAHFAAKPTFPSLKPGPQSHLAHWSWILRLAESLVCDAADWIQL